VVIANPNAPTGIALTLDEVETIVRSNPDHVVLIDEAYVDFGAESAVPLVHKYENLLVVHTFSKSRSMAGARLAYAIGGAAIIEDMNKMKYSFNPYNVGRLSQVMGLAALSEDAYYKSKQREIIETRMSAMSRLRALGFTMTNSKANFIFARHPEHAGEDLYLALRSRGILVRHFDTPRIADYLRITVGTAEQMDAAIAALTAIVGGK